MEKNVFWILQLGSKAQPLDLKCQLFFLSLILLFIKLTIQNVYLSLDKSSAS